MIKQTENIFTDQDIANISSGDVNVYELLFKHFYPSLVGFANAYIKNHDAAEDIVQEVFVKIWNERKKLTIKNIKTYLYTAVKNQCLNFLKHKKVEKNYLVSANNTHVDENTIETELNFNELKNAYEEAIQNLPEKCRIVICMNRFDDLSYVEIAEILDLSVNTIETHMKRALRSIRKALADFVNTSLLLG